MILKSNDRAGISSSNSRRLNHHLFEETILKILRKVARCVTLSTRSMKENPHTTATTSILETLIRSKDHNNSGAGRS